MNFIEGNVNKIVIDPFTREGAIAESIGIMVEMYRSTGVPPDEAQRLKTDLEKVEYKRNDAARLISLAQEVSGLPRQGTLFTYRGPKIPKSGANSAERRLPTNKPSANQFSAPRQFKQETLFEAK